MEAGALSYTRLDMIANPCEHSSILRLMCKVPWVVKNWPIQKLINRAHARSRFLAFFNANLDGLTLRQIDGAH